MDVWIVGSVEKSGESLSVAHTAESVLAHSGGRLSHAAAAAADDDLGSLCGLQSSEEGVSSSNIAKTSSSISNVRFTPVDLLRLPAPCRFGEALTRYPGMGGIRDGWRRRVPEGVGMRVAQTKVSGSVEGWFMITIMCMDKVWKEIKMKECKTIEEFVYDPPQKFETLVALFSSVFLLVKLITKVS